MDLMKNDKALLYYKKEFITKAPNTAVGFLTIAIVYSLIKKNIFTAGQENRRLVTMILRSVNT